jgi:predicted transcriptional regulator
MTKGDDILDNKLRRQIYNHISTYPGVSFNTLKSLFELKDRSLRYHLHILEKNEKISSGLEKGTRCYFPHPASVKILNKHLSNLESQEISREQEHILNIIKQNPGIMQKELINKARMNRFKVAREIRILKNLKLVKNTRIQNTVCYEYIPDVELKFRMLKGLIVKLLKNEIDEKTFLKLKKRLGE